MNYFYMWVNISQLRSLTQYLYSWPTTASATFFPFTSFFFSSILLLYCYPKLDEVLSYFWDLLAKAILLLAYFPQLQALILST